MLPKLAQLFVRELKQHCRLLCALLSCGKVEPFHCSVAGATLLPRLQLYRGGCRQIFRILGQGVALSWFCRFSVCPVHDTCRVCFAGRAFLLFLLPQLLRANLNCERDSRNPGVLHSGFFPGFPWVFCLAGKHQYFTLLRMMLLNPPR